MGYLCLILYNPSTDILHSPAYEDGTDSEFRNVGNYNSDAGELPKKKQITVTNSINMQFQLLFFGGIVCFSTFQHAMQSQQHLYRCDKTIEGGNKIG